jgi:hypothetical protein
VQSIDATVSISYYQDPTTGYWIYSYSVSNGTGSTNVIDVFGISPTDHIVSITAPPHWTALPGYQGNPDGIAWEVTDSYDTYPGAGDGLSPPPSPYAIVPGARTDGFGVIASRGPGFVNIYVDEYRPFLRDSIDVDEGDPFAVLDQTIWEVQTTNQYFGPGGPPTTVGTDSSGAERSTGAFPNPTRGEVAFRISLAQPGHVRVSVHDLQGREIRVLEDAMLEKGLHAWVWKGDDAAGVRARSGVYFIWLVEDRRRIATQRVSIIR